MPCRRSVAGCRRQAISTAKRAPGYDGEGVARTGRRRAVVVAVIVAFSVFVMVTGCADNTPR